MTQTLTRAQIKRIRKGAANGGKSALLILPFGSFRKAAPFFVSRFRQPLCSGSFVSPASFVNRLTRSLVFQSLDLTTPVRGSARLREKFMGRVLSIALGSFHSQRGIPTTGVASQPIPSVLPFSRYGSDQATG